MAMKWLYLLPCFLLLCEATNNSGDNTQACTKLQELSSAVQDVCGGSSIIASQTHPVGWTSVTMTRIGSSYLRSAHTVSYSIPSVIPNTAKEVFVYAYFQTGYSGPDTISHFKIYTEDNGKRYEQYISLRVHGQPAWNNNSDNLWFPMPRNRRIYMQIPYAHSGSTRGYLYAIGYR